METKQMSVRNEKYISLTDLIKYIKKNQESFNSVGCVDLNDIHDKSTDTYLNPLSFQECKKVTYLPENLKNIFKSDIFKYLHSGSLKTFNNINCSFFDSVLICLKSSLISQPMTYHINLMIKFQTILTNVIKSSTIHRPKTSIIEKNKKAKIIGMDKYGYKKKYGLLRTDFINDLTLQTFSPKIIKLISDFFHINIFILDIQKDQLFFGGGDLYVPFKKTIFLIKYNETTYDPFFTEQSKVFTFHDSIIKSIKENEHLIKSYKFIDSDTDLFSESLENLDIYIPVQKPKKQKTIISESKNDNEVINAFDDKEPVITNTSSNTKSLNKMTVKELQELAQKHKISLSVTENSKTTKRTKQQLIDELNKIKNIQ